MLHCDKNPLRHALALGAALLTLALAAPASVQPLRAQSTELGRDSAGTPPKGQFTASGLWYAQLGRGPAIVLIHGSNLDSRVMRPLADSLASRHRVILTDLRFHGRSKDDGASFSFAQDVMRVMDAAGVSRAVLLGHSLGADVALSMALLDSSRVDGLILLSPSVSGIRPSRPIEGLAPVIEAVRSGDLRRAGEALALSDAMRLRRDSTRAAELRRIVAENVALFSVNPSRVVAAAPTIGRLRQLPAVPLLAIVGSDDPTGADAAADSLRANVPGATVVALPGCGHILPFDCIKGVVDAMRAAPASGAGARGTSEHAMRSLQTREHHNPTM